MADADDTASSSSLVLGLPASRSMLTPSIELFRRIKYANTVVKQIDLIPEEVKTAICVGYAV